MEDLLTIAEYSALRGCSTTATYKRLDTTLKNYVVIQKGMKYIKKEVLEVEGITPSEPSQPTAANRSKPLATVRDDENNKTDTGADNVPEEKSQTEIDVMATVVKVLEAQTASKDLEIERLHKEIEELREQVKTANNARDEAERHNREQANKLTILLEQSQELQRNNQILIAQQQKSIEAPSQEGFRQDPEDVSKKDAEIEALRAQVKQLEEEKDKPKAGFFSKWFKRG